MFHFNTKRERGAANGADDGAPATQKNKIRSIRRPGYILSVNILFLSSTGQMHSCPRGYIQREYSLWGEIKVMLHSRELKCPESGHQTFPRNNDYGEALAKNTQIPRKT